MYIQPKIKNEPIFVGHLCLTSTTDAVMMSRNERQSFEPFEEAEGIEIPLQKS